MVRLILLCVFVLATFTACQNTYKQDIKEVRPLHEPLTARTRVYIAMPEDALDKNQAVAASGKRTTLAIQEAFQRHTRNIITAKIPENQPAALERARSLQCDYLCLPTILQWKDRPTEWTGVRDRLTLKLEIYSADTGELIRTGTIDATSRWMTDGGDAPQDLLADPVDKFVRGLFRMVSTPSALQK